MNSRNIVPFNPVPLMILAVSAAAWGQDRMPPIPADKLTPAQKKSVELLAATPRGVMGSQAKLGSVNALTQRMMPQSAPKNQPCFSGAAGWFGAGASTTGTG